MASLDIAVVGCGTGGPAAALFLARAGHRVTLYERVPDPGPVGAGILLQPTGLGVLADLGLVEGALSRGAVVRRLDGWTTGGRAVLDLAYADHDPRLHGVGIHRGVLFDLFLEVVRHSPVVLETGVGIAQVGGDTLVGEDGQRRGPFDLVVVADGARSTLRSTLGLRHRADPYPWGALWAVLEDPEQLFGDVLFQVYGDTRRMVGFLPTGLGPSGEVPLTSLFWSLPVGSEDTLLADGVAAFHRAVLEMVPRAAPLLEQVQTPDDLVMARYWDVRLARWHTDRVVVIGDAAHAMSPQLGQGANLALVDAWVLARALAGTAGVAAALQRYERLRRPHLRYYQLASRWLTPVFQSHFVPVAWPRDLLMAPFCRAPFFRDLMLTTLAGTRTGPFGTLADSPHRLALPG